MKFLSKLNKAIIKFESAAAVVLLTIIVFFAFFSAVTRYFNYSIVWSLDFTLLLFAWFSFFACSQAMRKKAHIGVTILTDKLPKKVQDAINVFNDVLMIAFMCVMITYSVRASILNWRQSIYTMKISYSFVSISLAVGGVFIVIALLVQIYEHICVLFGKKIHPDFEIY